MKFTKVMMIKIERGEPDVCVIHNFNVFNNFLCVITIIIILVKLL